MFKKTLCKDDNCEVCFNRSFVSYEGKTKDGKLKIDCWDKEKNGLTTRDVYKSCKYIAHFICDNCPHKFHKSLNSINHGNWCPFCCIQSHQLCENNSCNYCLERSLESDERKKSFHPTKNGEIIPRMILKQTKKKYWFLCSLCNYDFDIVIKNQKWCPICEIKQSYIFRSLINKWKTQIFKNNSEISTDIIHILKSNVKSNIYDKLNEKEKYFLKKNKNKIILAIEALYKKTYFKHNFCFGKLLNKYVNFHKIFHEFIHEVKCRFIKSPDDWYNLKYNELKKINNFNIVRRYFNIKMFNISFIYTQIKDKIDYLDLLSKITNYKLNNLNNKNIHREILLRTIKSHNINCTEIYNKTSTWWAKKKYNNIKLTFIISKYGGSMINVYNKLIDEKFQMNAWNKKLNLCYWFFNIKDKWDEEIYYENLKLYLSIIEKNNNLNTQDDWYGFLSQFKNNGGFANLFKTYSGSCFIHDRLLKKFNNTPYNLLEKCTKYKIWKYWKLPGNTFKLYNNVVEKQILLWWNDILDNIDIKNKQEFIYYYINTNFIRLNGGNFMLGRKWKIKDIVKKYFSGNNELTNKIGFIISREFYNKHRCSSHFYKVYYKILKNEEFINNLKNFGITILKLEEEKKFCDCKNNRKLPFDICIEYKLNNFTYIKIIEIDGEYHFRNSSAHSKNNMEYQEKNDIIKTNYCKSNKIPIFRIHHKDIEGLNQYSKITELKKTIIDFLLNENTILKLSREEDYEYLNQNPNNIVIVKPIKFGATRYKDFIIKRNAGVKKLIKYKNGIYNFSRSGTKQFTSNEEAAIYSDVSYLITLLTKYKNINIQNYFTNNYFNFPNKIKSYFELYGNNIDQYINNYEIKIEISDNEYKPKNNKKKPQKRKQNYKSDTRKYIGLEGHVVYSLKYMKYDKKNDIYKKIQRRPKNNIHNKYTNIIPNDTANTLLFFYDMYNYKKTRNPKKYYNYDKVFNEYTKCDNNLNTFKKKYNLEYYII